MTPTLLGRIESRLLLLATVGAAWTAIISPFLPAPAGMGVGDVYRLTYTALGIVFVLGIGWELVYHLLQQLRWNRDWPTLIGLLNGINEGATTWWALHLTNRLPGHPAVGYVPGTYGPANAIFPLFVIDFATTWILIWLAVQGPVKVFLVHWRFRGGQVL